MIKSHWVAWVILLGVVGLLAAFWLAVMDVPDESEGTSTLTYTSATYGYSFMYDPGVDLEEYQPSAVALGERTNGGFDADVEITVHESGEGDEHEEFAAYALERARTLCAADGPSMTINCTDVERREAFTSANGATGEVLYLTLVERTLPDGPEETSTFGPVYVFDIGYRVPDSDFVALLIYPPLATFDEGNIALVTRIAESLRLAPASN